MPGGFIYSYFIRAGHPEHGLVHYSDRFIDLWVKANGYEQIWRYDHNVPANESSWVIVRKVGDTEFQTPIDVQEGEDLPQLRQRPVACSRSCFGDCTRTIKRFRFSERIIERLLELKWWDLELSDISGLPFRDIESCLGKIEEIRARKNFDDGLT